ncbi:nicotinate phosphoribosyltransferase [Methylacidimicrobium cyclopophantes]|uniref:Nicotinate phosphoribosyltransferase n=1 Tax=Methylacidimicrobium cyclopophantes TaxID=1041766 RepID=A0A5E6MK96_9BACT|nr:nicotinate phosphoribosyltransferase [Methylacidimicrobium cyclopophantes]VVM05933.1 nicotinate phosphoribosyltransferase [Methylacidimicrobium cyclopophantes]
MNLESTILLTDLYELTMLQGYFHAGMNETAVFEFFVRKLPKNRNFLLVAGVEQALAFLESAHFEPEEIDWLATQGFRRESLEKLRDFRFQGDVHAMPEGTLCFPEEPILRITAPIPQAQLFESRIMNLLHFQTMIASKAARSVLVAPGKELVDFGLRRAHGAEAGLYAARAAFLAGFSATATVLAGKLFEIPLSGTMAHSFIQAHDSEEEAFLRFAEANPDRAVFLVDTYDTEEAVRKLVALTPRLEERGIRPLAVRLDSGDLGAHARRVRRILDDAGLRRVGIFASGNLTEERLQELVGTGAPIDGFGIGTSLDTSSDAPYLDCVYKLEEYAGRPRRKRSEGKATWPGRKQVFRRYDADGRIVSDLVALEGEDHPGEPLLVPVLRDGKRLSPPEPLRVARDRAARGLASLPSDLRGLSPAAAPYPVRFSTKLEALRSALDRS